MKGFSGDKIRNVALIGHGGCGKTTIIEAGLFSTGVINRMGKVEDGNTVSDYDKMEIEKGYSISTSVAPIIWDGIKINMIDTPGDFDFVGEVLESLQVSDASVIVVDASSGVQVGTEKAWKQAKKFDEPVFIVINKMDKENIDFQSVVEDIREKLGKSVAPFMIPIGGEAFKGYVDVVDMVAKDFTGSGLKDIPVPDELKPTLEATREMLIEAIAESDEALMEKYFDGVPFTKEEIHGGLRKGIATGDIVPVMASSAANNKGIIYLLDILKEYAPTPTEHVEYQGINPMTQEETLRKCSEDEKFSAVVFKTIVDPFVGKISLMHVHSGKMKVGNETYNATSDKTEKIGHMFFMRGKHQEETDIALAGDIVAVSKFQFAETGDTICDKADPIQYEKVEIPEPCLFMAVEPKDKGDEEKISSGLHKLTEEDPSFTVTRNNETHQTLIGGQGDIQISIITAKLKEKFGVNVNLIDQKIAYRETIRGSATVQGKHKKQSGGAGQYGDVHITFEPTTEDFEFQEKIFGGSVPKQYIPAVEKGLRECIEKGPLAGYPVVNVKATLIDGSYHDVDSNEMAFKLAATQAFKKGIQESKPAILEPIMNVTIKVPENYMGDIMGDMNKRRGKILGMEPQSDGTQKVMAEAPMAEMFKYAITLRAMTQARGEFSMEFSRYDELPTHMADKVIAAAKAE